MKSAAPQKTSVESTTQDSRRPESQTDTVSVNVARSIEELMQAFAIRAAVFLSEQHCPYAEEFDGNDFTATQYLGLVGGEPASTCRTRYFAEFAKLERVPVRREFRKSGVAAQMIDYSLELCRQKGYRRIYGHAQARLVPFWQKLLHLQNLRCERSTATGRQKRFKTGKARFGRTAWSRIRKPRILPAKTPATSAWSLTQWIYYMGAALTGLLSFHQIAILHVLRRASANMALPS